MNHMTMTWSLVMIDVDTAFEKWADQQDSDLTGPVRKGVFEVFKDGYEAGMIDSLKSVVDSED
jgi:hypothetical protein